MPSKKALMKILGKNDYFIAQYFGVGIAGKLQAWIFTSRHKWLDSNLKKIDFTPELTLDAGCGPLFEIQDLLRFQTSKYVGIDILPCERLKKYRNAMRNIAATDIEVIRASGESLPFQDKKFDLTFSLDVLEHLDNPKTCAAELGRTAKDNSILAISLPLENQLQRLLRIAFLFQKLSGDPTLRKATFRMMFKWIAETPSYHYRGDIKYYDAMVSMLQGLFTPLLTGYTPLGHRRQINVNAIHIFKKK
jgi:SAM-dependent methyltransferase